VNFSPLHRVQTGSEAHPASYPMAIGAISPRIKRPVREADHSAPSRTKVKKCVEVYVFMAWRLIKQ